MEVVTGMALVALGLKVGVAVLSVLGVSSGIGWFNKKSTNISLNLRKKGGLRHDDESETNSERFSRTNLR